MKGLNLWVSSKQVRYRWRSLMLSGLGVAIAFVLISTTFFVTDSVKMTLIDEKMELLGDLDLQVTYKGGTLLSQDLETKINSNNTLSSNIEGTSPRLVLRGVSANDLAELATSGIALIGLNFTKDQQLGPFLKDGITMDFSSLSRSQEENAPANATLPAVITKPLASSLELTRGSTFNAQIALLPMIKPIKVNFTVHEIVDAKGKAHFYAEKSIFVDLTILQKKIGLTGNITELAINVREQSNPSENWMVQQDLLAKNLETYLEQQGSENFRIVRTRIEYWQRSIIGSNNIQQFYMMMGFPSILASIFLVIIIFYLLIDERKKELASMMALGFKRHEIFLQLVSESLIMGTFGGSIGMLGGIVASSYTLKTLNTPVPEGQSFYFTNGVPFGLNYQLHVTMDSIILAFLLGLGIILLPTIFATWRLTKMEIAAALREHELTIIPRTHRQRGIIVSLLSVGLFLVGLFLLAVQKSSDFLLMFMAGSLLFYLGIAYLFEQPRAPSLIWTVVNFFMIWVVFNTNFLISFGVRFTSPTPFMYGLLYQLILASIFSVQLLPFLISLISRAASVLKSGALPLLYALSQLRSHQVRTFLVITIISVFLSIMFLASSFSASRSIAIERDVARITANSDYAAFLTSPINDPTLLVTRLHQYNLQGSLSYRDGWYYTRTLVTFNNPSPIAREYFEKVDLTTFTIKGINSSARDLLGIKLLDPSRYTDLSEEQLWKDFLDGKGILLSTAFFEDLEMPLTTITLQGENGSKELPILGFIDLDPYNLVIYASKELFRTLFPSLAGERILFFSFIQPVNQQDEDVYHRIESSLTKALLPWGPFVVNKYSLLEQTKPLLDATFITIENYLFISIIIGIVAIMLINSRKVQSQRFELGVLTCMGASRQDLTLSFLLETFFFLGVSIFLGYTTPVIFFGNIWEQAAGAPLTVPLVRVTSWALLTMITASLSGILVFRRLARMNPAEVLRQVE